MTHSTEALTQVVKCRDGLMIALRSDTYIGKALIKYGEYSQTEIDFLYRLLPEGGVAVDAGANHGTHTVALARRVGPRGRVLAFEPQPALFHILCGNVALNSLMNVRCFPFALSNEPGEAFMSLPGYQRDNNYGNVLIHETGNGVAVEVRKLDHLFREPRLDLVKADVEKMEQKLLEGAEKTLNRFRPVLYLEDEPDGTPALRSYLTDLGYRMWRHTPPLFNPRNFNQVAEDDWPNVVSFNLVCLPSERAGEIEGLKDPYLRDEVR